MRTKEFVTALKDERGAMLASYTSTGGGTFVGEQLNAAGLSEEQRSKVVAALDAALTDAFYTILLGLDGAASLGGSQQAYRITDKEGNVVSEGDGTLETFAYEILQTGS